ncbi:MAG TPA: hypothetical protein VMU34_12185 [Mycobacterium sp.]|nr:hypothetical protein [Mycobacterium sp.]
MTIDQRALPHELRQLRITTVDEVIDAIKTLAIRGAPAIGVAGAFGVALAARTHGGDVKKVAAEPERIAAARPTAVNWRGACSGRWTGCRTARRRSWMRRWRC